MTAKPKTLHFVIDGQWLTDRVRGLCDEDRPDAAMKILLDGLPGMTEDQALSIMEGRFRLSGTSDTGLTMVPEQKEVAGRQRKLVDIVKKLRAEKEDAEDKVADLVQMASGETVATGSPTGLRRIPRRKSANRGNRRTIKKGYRFDDTVGEPGDKVLSVYRDVDEDKVGIVLGADRAKYGQVRPNPIPEPEELEDVKPVPPEPEFKISETNGWLSPDGEFYRCQFFGHASLEYRLGLGLLPEEQGWVKLQNDGSEQHIFGFLFNSKVKPSKKQIQMVREFCQENNVELPFWAKEKP